MLLAAVTLVTAASCASASRGERIVPKDPTIHPGSLSGVVCGSSIADDVRATFGTDCFEEPEALDYTRWPDGTAKKIDELDAVRPARVAFGDGGFVSEIELRRFNRALTTEEGIGPGSSREAVERAYGKGPGGEDSYEDATRGYLLAFERGRVVTMRLRKPVRAPARGGGVAAPVASATDPARPLGPDRKPLGRTPVVVAEHPAEVVAVALSADGKKVFSGGANAIECHDLATGERSRFAVTTERVSSIAVGGGFLARNGIGQAIVHDVKTREVVARPVMGDAAAPTSAAVVAVAFSPDSRVLAVASTKELVLFDVGSWKASVRIPGHELATFAFSPDGTAIALADATSVRVLEAVNGNELVVLAHEHPVTAVAFKGDGVTLVTGTRGGGVKLWDASAGRSLASIGDEHATVRAMLFAGDDLLVASASKTPFSLWWLSPSTGWTSRALDGWEEPCAIAISPGGRILAVGTTAKHALVADFERSE